MARSVSRADKGGGVLERALSFRLLELVVCLIFVIVRGENGSQTEKAIHMNMFKLVSAILALCFWFSSFFVWRYFSAHGGHSASAGGAKMYPLDTHGSIVYITAGQHYLLYGLIVAGAALFLVTALLGYFGRKRSVVVG